ncbi:MAG: methyltransferase domain-containing protein [Telluria sp.]|nr:methyltransferase domain-containing protein [Telluria sp.]
MVFDETRNAFYARGIRKTVHHNSVVLDLGAGLGLHGLLAAASGAARVYMVEPEPVINAAREVARVSALADKLVITQARIEETRLPEPVDVIISVFTGNLLFSEDLLPSLFHARDRYLKPGGRMLPDRAELWLAPLCAPELHMKHVGRWGESVMGFDYSPVRRFAANEMVPLRPPELGGSERLAPGAVVSDLDLMTATHAECDGEASSRVEASALCHGLLAWIRIKVADEWMSNAPDEAVVHWSPVMLPVDPPLPLVQGETVVMKIRRPSRGDWTWSITAGAGSRRHSSFLARLEGSRELAKVAPGSRPGIGAEGRRALRALELLGHGMSIAAVAQAVGGADPELALQQVQRLAKRYGAETS